MRLDKEKIIALRKTGLSYNQISRQTGVAKSTLSAWLRDIPLSPSAKKKISHRVQHKSIQKLIERNKSQTAIARTRHQRARADGQKEFSTLATERLFIAGISLYWAEGYKMGAMGSRWKSVDFANADPEMIILMMRFFRKFCVTSDEKFKMQIIAHQNVSPQKALAFWAQKTAIPKSQFMKVSVAKSSASKKRRPPQRLPHGTLHIRINDVQLFFRIIGWIDELKKKI